MTETFSLTQEQARAYEDLFVPALFAQWVEPLLDCGGVATGHRVLDVACGTGVVARGAAHRVGPSGSVSGVDVNPSMLQVAREIEPTIDWREGDAAGLPYDDGSFDVALCQSALFFFPDPGAALREMARVVVPGGAVALQTYAGLDQQPGYGPFVETVVRHAGLGARDLLGTYWSKGDVDELVALLAASSLDVVTTRSVLGTASFPSTDALVHTEIQATPLARRIDDAAIQAIRDETRRTLASYTQPAGELRLPIRALFVGAVRPA